MLKFRTSTGRRTLLCVAEHGQIKTIGSLKRLTFAWASVSTAVLAAAVGLFFLHHAGKKDNARLKEELAVLKRQVLALRDERDVLLTTLVMADSRPPSAAADSPADSPNDSPKDSMETGSRGARSPESVTATDKSKDNPASDMSREVTGLPGLLAENFYVFQEPGTNTLKVRFVIRNTAPHLKRISGHIMVILKPDRPDREIDRESWVTIPYVPLISGRPSGEHKGLAFSISNFKNVRLKARGIETPRRFKLATVFIFARSGELLLEKDFPVRVEQTEGLPRKR